MASRGYGQGSVFQRKSDGRWIGRITRRGVIIAGFSALSREGVEERMDAWLAEHQPERLAPHVPRTRRPREETMIAARALGSHTEQEWAAYLATTDGRCHYCKREAGISPHRDHKTPVCRGGSDAIDNLVLACADCNMVKNAMTEEEFIEHATETGFFSKPRTRAVRKRAAWEAPLPPVWMKA